MKFEDLKQKSKEELQSELQNLRKKLVRQKVAASTGGDSKVASKIKNTKQDIARILTLINN